MGNQWEKDIYIILIIKIFNYIVDILIIVKFKAMEQ